MSDKNKTPEAVNQFLEDKQTIAEKEVYETPEGWVSAYELYKRKTKGNGNGGKKKNKKKTAITRHHWP